MWGVGIENLNSTPDLINESKVVGEAFRSGRNKEGGFDCDHLTPHP